MIFSMWTTTAGRCSSVLNWVISVWLLSAHSNRFFFEPSREIYCQANSQTLHRTSSYTFISDDRRQDDHWKGRTPHFDNFYNKSNIFCFKLNESSCSCSFRFVWWSQKPEFNMIALTFSKLKLPKGTSMYYVITKGEGGGQPNAYVCLRGGLGSCLHYQNLEKNAE